MPPEQRRWPRWLAGLGVVGCAVLAFTLPTISVATGAMVLGVGSALWATRQVMVKRGGR